MLLPDGYVLRHPEPGEAAAVQAVLDASETADAGEPRRHDNDVATEWRSVKCDPARDWWVAVAPPARIAAAGWVWPETPTELTADHYVDPGHRGRGLGEALLDAIEERAVELTVDSESRLRALVVWCAETDVTRRSSLDRRGFTTVRQYFEMEIALHENIEPPVWPAGLSVGELRSGIDDEAAYQADQEAFVEHHLYERLDYDEWRLFQLDSSGADATLWRLAWDGDDVAGLVIPLETDRGAVIDDLAVRKPWRRLGVGHALLLEAFAALRERGQSVARLMVDAGNVTNAVRVYEAAGMHVSRRFDVMEKPLV